MKANPYLDRQKVEAWMREQRRIFERSVKPVCGLARWEDIVWRIDECRRDRSAPDTELVVYFEQIVQFRNAASVSPTGDIVTDRFLEFAKALVIAKADSRNWSVSQVTLDHRVLSVGLLLTAALNMACEHPGDLLGRHFDEVQRLLVDAVDRRDRFVETEGLANSAKVNRFNADGEILVPKRLAYGLTLISAEIARFLDKARQGSKTIFTRHFKWDNNKLDSRSLERKRDKEALYPDIDALYFMADLAQRAHELHPRDRLMLRMFELMLVADKRIGEVLCLPVDALVERNGVLGLRYKPKKNASPYITWIPVNEEKAEEFKRNAKESDSEWTAARDMFRRAINEIIEITRPSRERAQKLEDAKALSDIELPPPSEEWPAFLQQVEVVGLTDGTNLSQYYTRNDLAAMHLNVNQRSEGEKVELPKAVKVTFKWRIEESDRVPFIPFAEYQSLQPSEKEHAFSSFVAQRLANRNETYVPLTHFVRFFCGLLSSTRYGGKSFQKQAGLWWRRYHAAIHRTEDVDELLKRFAGQSQKLFSKPRVLVHQDEIRRYVWDMYRSKRIVHRSRGVSGELTLNNALFCVDDDLLHVSTEYYPMVHPLLGNSFRNWMTGSGRRTSVFERFGRPELNSIAPHMLRRFNTTELRLAGVSSFYIARNAGRTVRRVDDYDYIENETLNEIGVSRLGTDVILEADYVRAQRLELEGHEIPFNRISDFLKEELASRNQTDFGSCSHEHSIGACPAYKACYMGCGEFWICKGDPQEVQRHRDDFRLTKAALIASKARLGDAFYSSHYVIQYGAQLLTLRRLLDLHADSTIPDGTMLKPAPLKRVPTAESIRALLEDDDALASTLQAIADLLDEPSA